MRCTIVELVARLTEAEFKATMCTPMHAVRAVRELPTGFWDYVDQIAPADFGGRSIRGDVSHAYADPTDRWHHLLIATDEDQVFLAIVLDVANNTVLGHHLLDLPRIYGVTEAG